MTKIAYVYSYHYAFEPIIDIAKTLGIQVIPTLIPMSATDEMIRSEIEIWEKEGVDVVFCRGAMEKKLRSYSMSPVLMGAEFTMETTVGLLADYVKLHPGFLSEKRKILLLSTRKLRHQVDVLSVLINAEFVNVSGISETPGPELVELSREYDLVLCGRSQARYLSQHGINAFYRQNPELESVVFGFKIADAIAKARNEAEEKREIVQNWIDNSFNAIASVDTEGKIIQFNMRFARYVNAEPEKLIGKDIFALIPELPREVMKTCRDSLRPSLGEPITLGNKLLVMNCFPIVKNQEFLGLGMQFDLVKTVEAIADKVRSETRVKGLIAKYRFEHILTVSEKMSFIKRVAMKYAKYNENVLLIGESGTGKELFAQSIHNNSMNKSGPFVALNCGALPSNLLESELFGYVGGAFTGASRTGKKGLLEMADHGTVFLDEISEMGLDGQVRLLRVLEERTITRIGDDRMIPISVRIIAASNKNLKKLVDEGKFRSDLYYRLNVLTLRIPPLREREGDIRMLATYFIDHFCSEIRKEIILTDEAKSALEHYSWPGNIRQLRNFCRQLVIISEKKTVDREQILYLIANTYSIPLEQIVDDEADEAANTSGSSERDAGKAELPEIDPASAGNTRKRSLEQKEREQILEALESCGGNRKRTAELLQMSTVSLWRKMKKYGIEEHYKKAMNITKNTNVK